MKVEQYEKRARELLMSHGGRAALKKFGIDVQISDEPDPDTLPKVAVLCPTYRSPEPKMRHALGEMVKACVGKALVFLGDPVGSSVVHWSRNALVMGLLTSGREWTHILFIDDDIVPEPDALLKLLSHGKDIVAGLCTRRQDPPIPNIRHWDEETKGYGTIWEWPEGALLEVGAVGTGLMLVSKFAMERVATAYFNCEYEKEFYGVTDEWVAKQRQVRLDHFDKVRTCGWFRFLPTLKGEAEYGEDISFCLMAKRYCGITSYVDTSVQPGHLGQYDFGIKDFIPYQQAMIEKAKAEGTFKSADEKPDESLVVIG